MNEHFRNRSRFGLGYKNAPQAENSNDGSHLESRPTIISPLAESRVQHLRYAEFADVQPDIGSCFIGQSPFSA